MAPSDSLKPGDSEVRRDGIVVGTDPSGRAVSSATAARQLPLNRGNLAHSWLRFLANNPKWIQLGIWTVVLGSMAVGLLMWFGGYLHITDAGYPAIFYLNLIGSATIILPLPGSLAACIAAESSLGFNLILIGVIGSAGATLGEITAYLAGYAGQSVVSNLKWYERVHDLMERRGGITIFIVSVIPTPFFDLAGIAAGALGYSFRKFMTYVFLGKTIRLVLMAYACRQGIDWLRTIYELNFPI